MLRSLLILTLGFSHNAWACTMLAMAPDLNLPGEVAGPDAVFSVTNDAVLLDAAGAEVDVTRTPLTVEGYDITILVPNAPLAAGSYTLDVCDQAICSFTIQADAGDPGEPPAPPEIELDRIHVSSGRWANCGPRIPARQASTQSDAQAVVFATEPTESLDGATLFGMAELMNGEFLFSTTDEVVLYAAALDSEGELSEWSEPLEFRSRGCSVVGGAPAWLLVMAGGLLVRLRRG